MKVFISYGTSADQVTALRLQALGAVNGLTVYVPPAYTRQVSPVIEDPDTAQKLSQAEVVLGLVATALTEACLRELTWASTANKHTIILAAPHVATSLGSNPNVIVIDPGNPDQALVHIVQHLKAMHAERSLQKAVLFLGSIALGLLIYTAADRS